MYLKNFRVQVERPMDLCAVFSTKERVASYLYALVLLASSEVESAALSGRVPPVFEYKKTRCYGIDYRLFLHAMIEWMASVGGGKRIDVESFFTKYFLPRKDASPFSRKLLVNFIFGEVYRVVNTLDNRRKFLDLPYYAPALFYMDEGKYAEVMTVFFFKERMADMLENYRESYEMFANIVADYGQRQPSGIGLKYSSAKRSEGEIYHAYSVLTTDGD